MISHIFTNSTCPSKTYDVALDFVYLGTVYRKILWYWRMGLIMLIDVHRGSSAVSRWSFLWFGKLVGLVPTERCEIKKGQIFGGAFVPQLWQFFIHNNSTTVKFPFNWSQSDKKAMACHGSKLDCIPRLGDGQGGHQSIIGIIGDSNVHHRNSHYWIHDHNPYTMFWP